MPVLDPCFEGPPPLSGPSSDWHKLEFSKALWFLGLENQGAIPGLEPTKSPGKRIPRGLQHTESWTVCVALLCRETGAGLRHPGKALTEPPSHFQGRDTSYYLHFTGEDTKVQEARSMWPSHNRDLDLNPALPRWWPFLVLVGITVQVSARACGVLCRISTFFCFLPP